MSRRGRFRTRDLLPFSLSVRIRRRRALLPAWREADARVRADSYLPWLCSVVGGWLDAGSGNLRAFDHAIRHCPADGAIVEIGSFLGLSTNALSYLAVKYAVSNPIFNCDPWQFEGIEEPIGGFFDAATDAYRDYARRTYRINVETFGAARMPHTFEMFSGDFFAAWSAGRELEDLFGAKVRLGGPIAFAYIDGNHTWEASRADFANVDRHLVPGGFVLFDDSEDDGPFGSTRSAHEVLADPRYELVFKTPNYFFRKK
jgi:Methyltransferase domain